MRYLKGDDFIPPLRRIQKNAIIQAAYDLVQKEGITALHARKLAKELTCSVQPIFHNFATMEELKSAVFQKIEATYNDYIIKHAQGDYAYKKMGLAYIKFAKEYPQFFQLLFMSEAKLKQSNYMVPSQLNDKLIKKGQEVTGLSDEEQKKFHFRVWVFTHGLAVLVATKTCQLTDCELEVLLQTTVQELLIGYKEKEQSK